MVDVLSRAVSTVSKAFGLRFGKEEAGVKLSPLGSGSVIDFPRPKTNSAS